jgi:hypothetical protein
MHGPLRKPRARRVPRQFSRRFKGFALEEGSRRARRHRCAWAHRRISRIREARVGVSAGETGRGSRHPKLDARDERDRGWRGATTMTCRDLNDSLEEYSSGELAPEVRRRLEQHLLGCPPCAAYVRSYRRAVGSLRRTDDLLDQLARPQAPRDLVDRILDATVHAGKAPGPRRR